MYDYSKLFAAVENLAVYVAMTPRGNAALADVVAAVSHARVDAVDDAEALEGMGDEMFVLQLEACANRNEISDLEEKVASLEAQVKGMTVVGDFQSFLLSEAISELKSKEQVIVVLQTLLDALLS